MNLPFHCENKEESFIKKMNTNQNFNQNEIVVTELWLLGNLVEKNLLEHTLILFYKQRFISNNRYKKTSWTVAYKTE